MGDPVATFFAGVNGCGKTTLYYNELERGNSFGYRINIDEIVTSFGDWKNPQDQMRASKIALKIRNKVINNREDFNQETTLCGHSIARLITTLRSLRYKIALYYISVDSPQIAKERVRMRVLKGGHNIDSHLIERRFFDSLRSLSVIHSLCDEVFVFDNTQGFSMLFDKQTTDYSLVLKEFIDEKLHT